MIDLGSAVAVAKEVDAWLAAVQTDKRTELSELTLLGRPLRKRVWEPLEKRLAGAKVVLISPGGALARFPLGALPGVEPDHFLGEEWALSWCPCRQCYRNCWQHLNNREPAPSPRSAMSTTEAVQEVRT